MLQDAFSSDFDPAIDGWTAYELIEGEVVRGTVARLPTPNSFNGTRLFVRVGNVGSVIAFHATASRGHMLLERALEGVGVGDEIEVAYHGKRETQDGAREYRVYQVRSL